MASVVREALDVVGPAADIIVVDDGSEDATAAVAASAGAMVMPMPFNVGVGGAMRAAYLYAHREGYDCVVQLDADGQHDPRYIGDLVAGLEHSDIVIGARFAGVGQFDVTRPRRWAMRFLSASLSMIVGTSLTDVTSGLRAVGPRAISLFSREFPSEYLGDTVESLVLAHRAGLTVSQIGVAMRPRQSGAPSQGPLKSMVYLSRAVLVLSLSLVRSTGQDSSRSVKDWNTEPR